ncbi:hypothetical protein [Hymenobacter sp. CRA2]|uniref:hypothetical protein n=1 Tax=Hymenobacter sp. CRA2 TaxID=1955620 RepID=UPI00098F6BC7|nr:hypothetical protein [Hymenobacter sp. CRA2]OON66242.1 hypothetical protein B0919_22415 [Hymenobacter sp. CRA2]
MAAVAELDDAHVVPSDEDASALCPECGELLAWHEHPCVAPPVTMAVAASDVAAVAQGPVYYKPSATTYAYDVGQIVQAAINTRAHTIIWRGQVKERHPATGLVHRVNVYWLNDGYWDCYREEELQVA